MRIIASSARCRRTFGPASCLKTFMALWMLAVRAAQIQRASARATSAATVGNGSAASLDASATAVSVLSGSSASSSSLSSWRMWSSSSGGSSCSASVSSKRCHRGAREWLSPQAVVPLSNVQERVRQAFVVMLVFFSTSAAGVQNPVRHETLHGVEAKVSTASSRHTDSAKKLHGLLFDAVFQRLLDRDVCWLQLRCVPPGMKSTWHSG